MILGTLSLSFDEHQSRWRAHLDAPIGSVTAWHDTRIDALLRLAQEICDPRGACADLLAYRAFCAGRGEPESDAMLEAFANWIGGAR